MDYSVHLPKGYQGQGDSHLSRIVQRLRRTLSETQRDFAYDTIRLDTARIGELAGILVDFAEDLHNSTGIWATYERYNTEFFGTALPLTSSGKDSDLGADFHPDRFRHLLWVLYPVLIDGLVLSPTHQDLIRVAETSNKCLSDAFSTVPKDSGVKAFLESPNEFGWNVKRKLVWLGTHSFMFRTLYARYMKEQPPRESEIAQTDDYLSKMHALVWNGRNRHPDRSPWHLSGRPEGFKELARAARRFFQYSAGQSLNAASGERHQRPAVSNQDRHEEESV